MALVIEQFKGRPDLFKARLDTIAALGSFSQFDFIIPDTSRSVYTIIYTTT